MGSLPFPILIGIASAISIVAIYFLWARKLPKK
jgi:hypothetical protein